MAGNSFYKRIEPDPALARAYAGMLEISDVLAARAADAMARGATRAGSRWLAASHRVDVAIRDLGRELDRLALRTAARSQRNIRTILDGTQVRPDPPGDGVRLRDRIRSRPIRASLPSGAVGIGDLDELNKAVNTRSPGRGDNRYWLVQEIGTGQTDRATGISIPRQRGRVAHGLFQPGDSPPDRSLFRAHPMFVARSKAGVNEPEHGLDRMVIRREIGGRHFMSEGTHVSVREHFTGYDRILREASTELLAAVRAL